MKSNLKNLTYKKVNKNNIDIAYNFQKNEWPHQPDREQFIKHYKMNSPKNINFIVYYKGDPIGITGVYEEEIDKSTLWLDWYCIDKKYRGIGLGKQILRDTIEYCKQFDDIYFLRAESNLSKTRESSWLYISEMDFIEKYTAEDTETEKYGYYICTKQLRKCTTNPLWNNKCLNFNNMYNSLRNNIKEIK